MKEIAVLSGKGGTGKTTLLASLAALNPEAILADCDVDAPNLHLLVAGETMEEGEFSASSLPSIDLAECTRCRVCTEACRFGAIHLDDLVKGPHIDPLSCEGCLLCWRLCPAQAISISERTSGRWRVSKTAGGIMFHAMLEPAEGNSGKLVSLLKRKARAHAADSGSSLLLVDGPPGIGCAAIAALSGVDMAILVAESTRSSLTDLERVVRLCHQMDVLPAVVINRWDLSPFLTGAIEEWTHQNKVALLGRIPFDDSVYQCASAGKVVSESSPAGKAISQIWKRAEALL
ncbi:MAG: P-loop NTPase [Euryarchaeota archaeon]|nr:P-loop NTPase [Euryarchaeota archaeon]